MEVWSRNKNEAKRNHAIPLEKPPPHTYQTPNLQNQQQHGLIIIIIIIILRSSSSSFSFSCCSNISSSNSNTNDSSNTYYRFQNEMVPRGLGRLDMVQFGWVLSTIAGSSYDDDNDDQYNYDEQWLGGGPGEGGRSFSS
jgi:hypothetical protein